MGKRRKVFSGAFKAKVALEAIREVKTAAQIASEFQVHPAQVARLKKQAVDGWRKFWRMGAEPLNHGTKYLPDLYEQIGKASYGAGLVEKNAKQTQALLRSNMRRNSPGKGRNSVRKF